MFKEHMQRPLAADAARFSLQAACKTADEDCFPWPDVVRCIGTALSHVPVRKVCCAIPAQGVSDADAACYLNRIAVPIISNASFRTQVQELSRPPHHPK